MISHLLLAGALALSSMVATSAVDEGFVQSDQPKTISVDASTGEVLSAAPVSASNTLIQPFTAYFNDCSSNRSCWKQAYAPLVPYGFTGSTTSGTWSGRGDFLTRDNRAKLCWLDPYWSGFPESNRPTVCIEEWVGKNTTISIGVAVTGKKVSLTN